MNQTIKKLGLALALPLMFASGVAARAADKELTIGYQLIVGPWLTAVADGAFEKATGYKINWRKFDSGAKAITAVASGDVQISVAGSSPIAAAVSRGVDAQLFWILDDIASAEAFVVRNGAKIDKPQDLKGKKLGVPFVSTTHFHMMFALEHWGIKPEEVELLNMQPNQIAAAWERGDIDGAFIWDPALGRIKQSGKVLITSGELCQLGKCTFDGLIVSRAFAEANPDFMAKFVKVIAAADAAYRDKPEVWTTDSPMTDKIRNRIGGTAQDVVGGLALYKFPTLDEQASCAWLGCGKKGGATRALQFTAEFLKAQGKIDALQPDYSRFVTAKYVEAAMALK